MCLNIQGKEKFVSEAEYVIEFFFLEKILVALHIKPVSEYRERAGIYILRVALPTWVEAQFAITEHITWIVRLFARLTQGWIAPKVYIWIFSK